MIKKRHLSLKDLARELGVSTSTISRGLKGHPDISTKLAQKIQALAKLRNYTPNPLAMGLRKQTTKTIGVIVPDIVTYFYSSIISGMEDAAREAGYYIVIASSGESYKKEIECISNLLNLRVEGLLVCLAQDTSTYDHYDKMIEKEIPTVFFDRVCRREEFSCVVANNQEAAKAITVHFFKNGSLRIAHIAGPPHLNITKERIEGYREGLNACGLPFDEELLVYSDLSAQSAQVATHQLLDLPSLPDAIFGVNDVVAFAAMKEIKSKGLKIPQDIALIGFTDEFHSTFVEPALTSVTHPTFEMGRQAARLLLDQIQTINKILPCKIVMETELIVRQSSVKNNKQVVL